MGITGGITETHNLRSSNLRHKRRARRGVILVIVTGMILVLLAFVGLAFGISNCNATATSYYQDSAGTTVSCTVSGVRAYVKVATAITYTLMIPWPGLINPLNIGGIAITRRQ